MLLVLTYVVLNEPAPRPLADSISLQERDSVLGADTLEAVTASGGVDAGDVGRLVERTRLPDSDGYDFRARFTEYETSTSPASPLGGVRVILTSLEGNQVYEAESGVSGEISLRGLEGGRYRISVSHECLLPRSSNVHPQSTIVVPGSDVRVGFSRAYACAVKKVGPNVVDCRMMPGGEGWTRTGFVSCPEIEVLHKEMRSRISGGEEIELRVFGIEGPRSSSLTADFFLFDRVKGPCLFRVPVLPVCEIHEAVVCDVNQRTVVEPMSSVRMIVRDLDGEQVDVGTFRLSWVGSFPPHGFLTTSVRANGIAHVPPGTYKVFADRVVVAPVVSTQIVSLSPGQDLELRATVPVALQPTRVSLRLRGQPFAGVVFAQLLSNDGKRPRGDLFEIREGETVPLPIGFAELSCVFFDESRKIATRVKFEVIPASDAHAVTIDLD